MLEERQHAVTLDRGALGSVVDRDLRAYAAATLPKIEAHLVHAKSLASLAAEPPRSAVTNVRVAPPMTQEATPMDQRLNSSFWTLRIAFGLTAFLAGLDKFLNLLTNWEQYASPLVLDIVPLSAGTLMRVAGVIEIIVGIAVLAGLTRLGGYVVAAWLTLIALSLLTTGRYFDVAVRDLVMACGAFVLARLSEVREEVPARAAKRFASATA